MDVMSPQLIWIGGRCYRVNLKNQEESSNKPENAPYMEEDLYNEDDDGDDFEIQTTDNDRFKSTYHIPQIFFSQIIGARGTTKRRIEAETKTQIRIPKPGVEGDVVIIGPARQNVSAVRRKIDLIVLAARNKHQFTHFLCVPITEKSIKDSFIKFRDDILGASDAFGLHSSLFQNPNKLHLTIVTLSLMDNNDRVLAAQILQECKETIIGPILKEYGFIHLNVKGLEYMNDDASAVDVLYGKIESYPMQLIANGIVDCFAEKGLIQKKTDNVKMHVTLINSLFRDDDINQDNNTPQKRQTFDARKIIEIYGNYDFGTQLITEIHLSQRYSTSCDGFYEATGILKL